MKPLPETDDPIVLRTDYSDGAAWELLMEAVRAPVGPFRAHVHFLSNEAFAGVAADQVLASPGAALKHGFVFLADRATHSDPEHPLLVLDLAEEPGRTFRVLPSEMWGVENNLSIANMDFAEFADNVDPDGVFRGFPS